MLKIWRKQYKKGVDQSGIEKGAYQSGTEKGED